MKSELSNPQSAKSRRVRNENSNSNIYLRSISPNNLDYSDKVFEFLETSQTRKNLTKIKNRVDKLSIENFQNQVEKIMPFDEYKGEMLNMMSNYKTESDKKPIHIHEKIDEMPTLVKITIDNEEKYRNPVDSQEIIEINRKIFKKILENNFNRQNQLFFEKVQAANSVKLPTIKVRVTNIMPKFNDLPKANINEIANKVNLNQNVFNAGSADMYGYYIYFKGNMPECREQFSICGDSKYFYVFGGISSKSYSDMWILDPSLNTFTKMKFETSPPNPRYGHTATYFQKKIYLFGGRIKTHNFSYLADIETFGIDDKIWSSPPLITKSDIKRRNHIAELIGNQILFHGGFGEDGNILSDTLLLNLNPLKWIKLHLNEKTLNPALAGHKSCLVLPNEIKNNVRFNIYKYPDLNGINLRRFKNRIVEKGVYVFGGKTETGLSNEIYVLRIGKKPVDWMLLESKGKQPSPRYNHSMEFYEDGNFLIVYGGRNDTRSEFSALNDIFVFELQRQEWIEICIFSDTKINIFNRCGHSSFLNGSNLYIFGGMNNQNYIGSSMFVLNLESCYNYNTESTKSYDDLDKFRHYFNRVLSGNFSKKNKKKGNDLLFNSNKLLPPIK